MKTERNILIAFLLNLFFSLFEFVGGILTGSVAILSDSVHDLGDAVSIGVSYYLERKSKRHADENFSYGYGRFSVLGGIISSLVLLVGSCLTIYNAVHRIFNPVPTHYDGMILIALFGVAVNAIAAFCTRDGHSFNQKAVSLHMLEDTLGWAIVLLGAIVMRFTDFTLLDPILSIGVSCFILFHALRNLKGAADLFLEKVPSEINIEELQACISAIKGIEDVHHLHVRSFDGEQSCATMHIVTDGNPAQIKSQVRKCLQGFGIVHATLEFEGIGEECHDTNCMLHTQKQKAHHHCHHG